MRRLAKRFLATAICLAAAAVVLAPSVGAANRCSNPAGCLRVLRVSGLIDPIVVDFVERSVTEVEATEGYVGVVLELDSDGVVVSDAEFERFVTRLRSATVPVSAWVGTGSRALGGAAELVVSLPHSAMAAGSVIGDVGEQRLSIAAYPDELRGSGAEIRDRAVSAGRAKDLGLVEFAVPTFPQYLALLDGVTTHATTVKGKPTTKLDTSVVFSKPDLFAQLLHTVASPAVTYLLLAVGIGLLLFEFFTAGVGIAGVIGAASALGAGYGLGVLPFRTWALVALLLGGVAFAVDIQAGIPRFWTAVGSVLWMVGSFGLFDGVHLPYPALATGLIGMAIAMVSGMPAMVRARFGTPTIGRDWMIGELGTVVGAVAPDGVVEIRGATWRARTNRATPLAAGDAARVVAIDGLTLEVEPLDGAAIDYRERRGTARSS